MNQNFDKPHDKIKKKNEYRVYFIFGIDLYTTEFCVSRHEYLI